MSKPTRLTWSGNQSAQKQADAAWKKLKASNAKSKAKKRWSDKKKRLLRREQIGLAAKLLSVDPFTIDQHPGI